MTGSGRRGDLVGFFGGLAETNFSVTLFQVCFRARTATTREIFCPRWLPANRTRENLDAGKNCQVAEDVIIATFQAGRADALATSKKWTQPKTPFGLLRKFTIKLIVLWLCTKNFPSI